jgi:hypothetical protein
LVLIGNALRSRCPSLCDEESQQEYSTNEREHQMSYLGTKMLKMQDELQKFRTVLDERSRFSTRSFKSNRMRSAKESNISTQSKAHDSFPTI